MEKLDYRYQSAWTYTTKSENESPIAIDTQAIRVGADWTVDWSGLTKTDIRHRLETTGDQFYCHGTLTLNGEKWRVIRFHMHDGAEHLIDNQRDAAEIHLVCQNAAGQTLVLAVFAKEDLQKENLFAPLYTHESKNLNLADFLPEQKDEVYTYVGTLTTPPLQSNITWFILSEPLGISTGDLASFAQAYPDNHRDCQPIGNRVVEMHHLNEVTD